MSADTQILGKYRVIREIGRSNDIVYEAEDPALRRRIALKELLLPPNISPAQKQERIDRFYREAKAAGGLTHPNIVTVYEVGEDNGRHFIAMEFLEGESLREVLQRKGALPVQEAVDITLQVCDALSYAHARGVIHRDIKPDNIQMLPNGRIKITDFGIARIADEPSITVDGQIFGTPSYMSPEQVAGKDLDHRTDVFSLGVTLYEMLAGHKPFTGDTVVTITYNIMNREPTPPPGVPAYLAAVVNKAMAKNPADRYPSAMDMAQDLRSQRAPVSLGGPFQQQSVTGQYGQQASTSAAPTAFSHSVPPPPLPPIPAKQWKPLLTASQKNTLALFSIAVLLAAALVFVIWAVNLAYEGYRNQVSSEKAERHLQIGTKLLKRGEYNAAIEELEKAIELSPNTRISAVARHNAAEAYVALGDKADKAGDLRDAVGYFDRAAGLAPESGRPHLFLGNTYYRMGDPDRAVAEWRKAIEIEPAGPYANQARENVGTVYYNEGVRRYNMGDRDGAIAYWRQTMEIAAGTDAAVKAREKLMAVMSGGG